MLSLRCHLIHLTSLGIEAMSQGGELLLPLAVPYNEAPVSLEKLAIYGLIEVAFTGRLMLRPPPSCPLLLEGRDLGLSSWYVVRDAELLYIGIHQVLLFRSECAIVG
jgi:hypothetical protein